ncbi:MAG: flagellar motor protein MotB [Chthoniobacteraceae bacterium]
MAKKAEAHHGGAWKVAYADFVTAMMALFMVLWITAQDKEILLATSRYFKQPFNAMTDRSVGVMPGKNGGSVGNDKTRNTAAAANLSFMNAVASELSKMLDVQDTSAEKMADIEVTSDELRVTLYDRNARPLFQTGSAKPTDWGQLVLQNLAWIIDRNQLKVYIDGYTATTPRSSPGAGDQNYGPWELSADRANATRRTLEHFAVDPKKIERVTGYGDRRPLPNKPPEADANDRITISLSTHK